MMEWNGNESGNEVKCYSVVKQQVDVSVPPHRRVVQPGVDDSRDVFGAVRYGDGNGHGPVPDLHKVYQPLKPVQRPQRE